MLLVSSLTSLSNLWLITLPTRADKASLTFQSFHLLWSQEFVQGIKAIQELVVLFLEFLF